MRSKNTTQNAQVPSKLRGAAQRKISRRASRAGFVRHLAIESLEGRRLLAAIDDYGDAPESYGTLLAGNLATGPSLGTAPDVELTGQPSVGADGDGADEDGVRQGSLATNGPFNQIELADQNATFTVIINNPSAGPVQVAPANLMGWIDWEHDGTFDDRDRFQVRFPIFFNSISPTFAVAIPNFALPGATYARFRVSADFSNDPTAYLQSGEIEDYAVNIIDSRGPKAVADTIFTTEDVANVVVDVLSNDVARPAASPVLVSFDVVSLNGGTISLDDRGTPTDLSDDRLQYTPPPDFFGQDFFSYAMNDTAAGGVSTAAIVTINVAAVNDPPVTGEDILIVPSNSTDTPLNVLLNDRPGPPNESDQTLQIVAVSNAVNGTVSLNNATGIITFTPAPNFFGAASFQYTVQDSPGLTSTSTVTVTVTTNHAPIAGVDAFDVFASVPRDIPVADLLANDVAGPPNESDQTLQIVAVSNAVNCTVSLNTATGIITLRTVFGFAGAASFQYTVQDSGPTGGTNVNSATGTVNVTVLNYIPSSFRGVVYIDDNLDERPDVTDLRIGGVEVHLTVPATATSPSQTLTKQTLADGSYSFNLLPPGRNVPTFLRPLRFGI